MTLKMKMKYNLRDIVQTMPEFGSRQFIIVGFEDDVYWGKQLGADKKYKITLDQIEKKIGVDSGPEEQLSTFEEQVEFCETNVNRFPDEKEKWLFLSMCGPGEKIKLIHKNHIHTAELIQINLNKPLRPIRAKLQGRIYDFALVSLVF